MPQRYRSFNLKIKRFGNKAFFNSIWIAIYLLSVPTFDTKVTEYLCSGGFFQTNFDFLTSHF